MEDKSQEVNITGTATATEEERRWVKMLSQGQTANSIAEELKINKNTFAYKLANLRKRFLCDTNNELVASFLRNTLID